MADTVGVIGTMYECRKNGKIGVLESRDDKYRTLLFRDKEGGTFNITYSTFKSNWRKYTGDEVIETSGQTTERKEEAEKAAEQASQSLDEVKPLPKDRKRRTQLFDTATKHSITDDVKDIVNNAIVALNLDITTSVNTKCGIMVKTGNKKLFEVWPDFSKNPIEEIHVFLPKEIWDEVQFPEKIGDIQAEYYEKWKLQFKAMIPKDVIAPALEAIMSVVDNLYFTEEEEE